MNCSINLHELANSHGFGKAQKIIKAAGFWDEKAAPCADGKRTYTVTVAAEAIMTAYIEIEVDAESEEEAGKKALAEARATDSSDWDVEDDDVDIRTFTSEVSEITCEPED